MTLKEFLDKVEEIYQEQPDYERGHDGSDGKCDCIGLPKGAMRRCGVTPKGMKGTNYAARYTIREFREIGNARELSIGEVVIKAREPGDPYYDLPDEYKPGGASYNGDLKDYSHIGIVTGVNPLIITHMTSPKPLKDTKLGKWKYHGWLPQIDGIQPEPDPGPEPQPDPDPKSATVWAPSGATVNIRKGPSTSKALVERVPIGSTVEILDYEPEWCQVCYTDKARAKWYGWMMTDFLIFDEDPEPEPQPEPTPEPDPEPEPEPATDEIHITLPAYMAEELRYIMENICSQIDEQDGEGGGLNAGCETAGRRSQLE